MNSKRPAQKEWPFARSLIHRRSILLGSLAAASGLLSYPPKAASQSGVESVKAAIAEFEQSPELSIPNFGMREFAENFPSLQLERAPARTAPSELPISDLSKKLIVAFEISSEAIYKQRYQQPTWPGGMSGVTIGIGYDVGYVKPEELRADWAGLINEKDLNALSQTCGATNTAAKEMIASLSGVAIPWAEANKEFEGELKKYVGMTLKALPNFAALSEHCRGALVSLVYNRGPSFDAPGDRYNEMRNIRAHMVLKNFSKIPEEIRKMERLWPDVRGLIKRREAEANLFEAGLS